MNLKSNNYLSFWLVLRVLYGIFFIAIGAAIVGSNTMNWPPRIIQKTVAAQSFMDALQAARFIEPVLACVYLFGGLCLMRARLAPIGLLLLAPPVSVILAFHLVLDGDFLPGIICFGIWAALTWHFRSVFERLWMPPGAA